MDGKKIKALVTRLKLPLGEYVIIGSGNLAMRSIRLTEDLDLYVTTDLYRQLKLRYGGEVFLYGQHYLEFYVNGTEINAHAEWKMPGYQPDFMSYIKQPEMVGGLPFMPLADLYKWKAVTRRDKDITDLKLIEAYWQTPQKSVK